MPNDAIERLVSETIEVMLAKPPLMKGQRSEQRAWVATGDPGEWLAEGWQPAPWLNDDRYTMRLWDELPFGRRQRLTHCEGEVRRLQTCHEWLQWRGVPIEG